MVSGEVKLAKPDPRIFQLLFRRCGFKPEEAVYIDDLIENIEAARRFSMRGIHFCSPEQVGIELEKFGVFAP